tara:strand:- start:499 stop:645 length:147 start_codon:yes stop_codon:yes gene_type:complete
MKNLKNLELFRDEPLPKLRVPRAVWKAQPDFKISAARGQTLEDLTIER